MTDPVARANKELILTYLDEMFAQRRGVEAMRDHWADQVFEGNFGRMVDIEKAIAVQESLFRSFPDWQARIEQVVADGDVVAARMTMYGHLQEPCWLLEGVEATGQLVEWPRTHWYRIRDNKVVEHYATRDDATAQRQASGRPAMLDSAQGRPVPRGTGGR